VSLLPTAYALTLKAHEGQTDKLGAPYIEHVRAVAEGLLWLGNDEVTAAGWLHDVLEDTDLTREDLLAAGMTERVVQIVEQVTNRPGSSYLDKIRSITDPDAVLVKIADNAHNSRQDRLSQLDKDTYVRLSLKYQQARRILWRQAERNTVASILRIVNPDLMHQVECDFCWNRLEEE
jgi:(p)ppGpp synthase/HD superfamily hydrolase